MKKCVLVVEDDPLIRMDAVDVVQSAGYDVIEATSADDALIKLEQHDAIAIIVTDVEMPGSMNGINLSFVVRDRWPTVHIVVLSGRARPQPQELPDRAIFIPKPYQPRQIEDALKLAA